MPSYVKLGEAASPHLPAPVPYAVLSPESSEALPLCILLLGAGGSRDNLAGLQPVFNGWWAEKSVPPMAVAVPSAGLDYYLEDSTGRLRWDSFLADTFMPHLRSVANITTVTLLAGISGGGYGALKLAFARPQLFTAVAAMQPMLQPGLRASDAGPRNRLHHGAGGPPQLIGPAPDAALWEANNPANRARANADAIRASKLAIYLEAGDQDFLNAHDGAEFLHRELWDLDVPHEYHLFHGADHGGPSMRPRLRRLFRWLGSIVRPAPLDEAAETAAAEWIASGMQGTPPPGATTTAAFLSVMRARFEPLRAEAAAGDPDVLRTLGRL